MKKAVSMDNIIQNYRVLLTEDEENALFDLWEETRSNAVMLQIVQSFSPIIQRCVREVSGYKANPEDLRSEGVIAIIEAAKRFDRTRGRFSAYAKRCVSGIMLGYITKNYFPVNVCTSHGKKKLFYAIRRLVAITLIEKGKFDMTREIALRLAEDNKVDEKIVYSLYDMIRRPYISLSDNAGSEAFNSDHTIEEHMSAMDDDIDIPAEIADMCVHRKIISNAMDQVLDDRERRIFTSQVLVQRGDRIILEHLGQEFNISKERVRQLRNSAYTKVKGAIIRNIGKTPNMF
jgi:RNA polymerase sigma-32 factor